MVRPGLRRSEIDWENVDIHISREEMEREQEHEAAIQQAKQYLIKNFPKFCTINNGYYETETFNHDAGMYEVMHVDHIVIGDQAIYVIKTVKFPEHVELYGSSDAKNWYYAENTDKQETHKHKVDNADKRNQSYCEYIQMLAGEAIRRDVPAIAIVNIIGLSDEQIHLDIESGHEVVTMDKLAEFDGTCLYEYADPRMGEHPDWGTKIFDYGKNEVKNFLIGSALMWVEHYHIDGLRVDAVASMLYLDYGKEEGQWVRNKYGDNKNLEAIEFFKHINTLILGRNHGAVMIAEESTAWPKVTGPVEEDGLNFSYKWNMGWMHDFLDYMKLDPYFRKNNHHKMTFAMSYNASEHYILVLSHDEVVHLKCSMLNKMPGLGRDKFQNLMAGYAFMLGHPGKKLLFMGQEFAQLQEWSEERELDWYLLENPDHKHMQDWVKALLHLYQKNPCLYELDGNWDGFEWINADDADRSIYSFVRKSKDGKNNMLFVCNFTPVARPDYRVGVPKKKTYKLVLDSDAAEFGGEGVEKPVSYKAVKSECDGRAFSFAYPLSGYGIAVFKY